MCVSVAHVCDVRPRFNWTKAMVVVRRVIRAGQNKKEAAQYGTLTLVCLRFIVFCTKKQRIPERLRCVQPLLRSRGG